MSPYFRCISLYFSILKEDGLSPVAMLHDMVRKPAKKDASETRPTQTMAHFGGMGIMSPYFPPISPYFP